MRIKEIIIIRVQLFLCPDLAYAEKKVQGELIAIPRGVNWHSSCEVHDFSLVEENPVTASQ